MAGEVLTWFRAKPDASVHIIAEMLPNGDRVALCGRRLSEAGKWTEYERTLRRAVAWGNDAYLYATCTACTDKQWRIERAGKIEVKKSDG